MNIIHFPVSEILKLQEVLFKSIDFLLKGTMKIMICNFFDLKVHDWDVEADGLPKILTPPFYTTSKNTAWALKK